LFDDYQVDLVISGHVHAYERTNPMRKSAVTRHVARGGTIEPATDGTTYICAGGGGNGLYSTWYGTTDAGDAGNATGPKVWRWSGGDAPTTRGSGATEHVTDPVTEYSACRRAVWHCLVVDVTAPTATSPTTTMSVKALMPAQTSTGVTGVGYPVAFDSPQQHLRAGPAGASSLPRTRSTATRAAHHCATSRPAPC